MVARVATFEGVDMEAAEAMGDEAEARIRPLVEGLAGYQGYLDLGSASGNMISVTFFDTEANAEAAERTFEEEMPRALADLYAKWSGRRVAVERYRVLSESRSR